jgi:hypothetical protein
MIPGLLVLAQRLEVGGQVLDRQLSVWVVVAQDVAASGEGVLVEIAGLLVLGQGMQIHGQVVGGPEGVGVVGAEDAAASGEGVLVKVAGLLVLGQGTEPSRVLCRCHVGAVGGLLGSVVGLFELFGGEHPE